MSDEASGRASDGDTSANERETSVNRLDLGLVFSQADLPKLHYYCSHQRARFFLNLARTYFILLCLLLFAIQ
jgi:hypothetical protein